MADIPSAGDVPAVVHHWLTWISAVVGGFTGMALAVARWFSKMRADINDLRHRTDSFEWKAGQILETSTGCRDRREQVEDKIFERMDSLSQSIAELRGEVRRAMNGNSSKH